MELKCGVCGIEAELPDEQLGDSGWEPYVYNGDEEVSPVCPKHQVDRDSEGVGHLIDD